MVVSKKFFEILQMSFEVKYIDEDSNKLPKKKNKMVKALEERMDVLYNHVINVSTDPRFDDIVALAAAYLNISKVYVKSTEINELRTGVEHLTRCMQLLKENQIDRKALLTSIAALNELNLVCDKLEEDKKHTYKFLNLAMELYWKYTVKDDYADPIHIATIVNIKEEESNPKIILDNLHFITLQELGIHYFAEPKDKHRFICYVHHMLNNVLSVMISEGKSFEEKSFDWALTLFDLSKYFLANDRFTEARHHIATADYVLYRFSEDRLKTLGEKDKSKFSHLYDSYEYICAVSARCWGIYGVSLLRFWMEKFLQNGKEKSNETEKNSKATKLLFSSLEKELEHMTNQITETCISNLTDAKSIFVQTVRHLGTAKEYFVPETDIESYAKIILEISRAYKYLAGFEQQRDKQIKLHKRRVDFLEEVCKKFHAIINVDSELLTYKEVWYELVTSCSTVMNLTFEESLYNESFKKLSKKVDRFANLILENIDLYVNVS